MKGNVDTSRSQITTSDCFVGGLNPFPVKGNVDTSRSQITTSDCFVGGLNPFLVKGNVDTSRSQITTTTHAPDQMARWRSESLSSGMKFEQYNRPVNAAPAPSKKKSTVGDLTLSSPM